MRLICVIIGVIFFQTVSAQREEILKLPENIKPKDRIAFALYTVHENTVKITAQFYPIHNMEPFEAILEIKENGKWMVKKTSDILYPGYTAHFRIDNWDDTKDQQYRVVHNRKAFFDGIIKKNPKNKENFVMASFSCMSIYPKHGGQESTDDIVENLKKLNPDLLFFAGDQVYDHSQHYLYWLEFGRRFRDVMRNTPTITIPDDHDIGQANIWGAGGKKATARNGMSGGYYMPVAYVNEVQRAQTWHLPDAYDPTPIERGITVYYTDLKWGGMSFAILEDRKFKSGLEGVIEQVGPQLDAVLIPGVDPKQFDVEGATLLGERQLKFLEDWTTDWKDASMKSVLSQTIFTYASTYSGVYGKQVYADFDTNGWPQTGRNKALAVIRKSFSTMVAGDQHLGSVIRHGIDDWGDAGYSFATPAVASYWVRWWEPKQPAIKSIKGKPSYCGDYLDGFDNKITMLAAANPISADKSSKTELLNSRGAGWGIVRYNKKERTTTFECWERNVDVTAPDSKPYEGWPITVNQLDNFNIKKGYQLPKLTISKENQVVTIRKSSDRAVISSIRIKGISIQPKVLTEGNYTVEIGEGDNKQLFYNVKALKKNKNKLAVSL
ncbi:metallophosphoesterase family protein [Lutibacter citreus]|uniref:hypothetical protein n=1 Tax=Lutibacter citreus TaxID=2138210 RepID=UPI001FEC105D|nr:hypothetical protein [Lutibacter citreus]